MNIKPVQIIAIGLMGLLTIGGCHGPETLYVKSVRFPEGAGLEEKVELASRVIPSTQQQEWQKMELSAFIHFGMNTFTDQEWGDGTENPATFNPTDLDAEQWARTFKEAGFKMIILTAKHHDGFCLWPSSYTEHTVAHSPWKDGNGDVVKEVRDACEKYGLKFGVYLSPWDRNSPYYGDSPAYNEYFINQLTELLTNYGTVHEVWFDGACAEGPNGKLQEYDWEAYYDVIHTLQPEAVVAIMGDDIRWVGNEKGLGRETEWSATVLPADGLPRASAIRKELGIGNNSKDLGSREMLAKAGEVFWYPSEVDVSIRPGWFYHNSQDAMVKSVKELTDIYFESVGMNSVLLLNVPPDTRGRINPADSSMLAGMAGYINKTFSADLVVNGEEKWGKKNRKEFELSENTIVNCVMLQEDISQGQHVEDFTVEAYTEDGWKVVAVGTTVGYKRLIRFNPVKTGKVAVTINSYRRSPNISRVGIFYAEPIIETCTQLVWNDIPREGWTVLSEEPLTIDLGAEYELNAFTYAPMDAKAKASMAYHFELGASTDGENWVTVIQNGEFSNIMNNPAPMRVDFACPLQTRYLRITATSPDDGVAEILPEELGLSLMPPAEDDEDDEEQ